MPFGGWAWTHYAWMKCTGKVIGHKPKATGEEVVGLRSERPNRQPVLDALTGILKEYLERIGPHTEADPMALLFDFLTSFGSMIGNRTFLEIEGTRHYFNLFVVLVGDSSKARKGTARDQVRKLFQLVDQDWAKKHEATGLSSGEGLIEAANHEECGKTLLVIEPEFASVLKRMNRESNCLSAVLRNAWDAKTMRTLTRNSPLRVDGAHISLIGHITTEELTHYLTNTEAGNGFGNRFLWVSVQRANILPHGGQGVELGHVAKALGEAVDKAQKPIKVEMDSDARKLWEEVYPELSEGHPGMVGALTARGEAQTKRLAGLLALLDLKETISEAHLRTALALWEYCRQSVEYVFGEIEETPLPQRLYGLIRASDKSLTRTDLYLLDGARASRNEMSKALEIVSEMPEIWVKVVSTGGRPKTLYGYRTKRLGDEPVRFNSEGLPYGS